MSELDKVEIENNLVFLERCQLTGKEAETLVKLRYKLISMRDEILEAEKLQADPPTSPPLPNGG